MSERCPECGHIPREGFGCTGRPTPSDIWAGVYPGDCDCECPRTSQGDAAEMGGGSR